MKKIISIILVMIISFTLLSGCSKKAKTTSYNITENALDSAVIAENDNLTLSYNNENNSISLLCKTTGKIWSDNPDNNGDRSTFNINVQDNRTVKEETYSSYDAKIISAEKIENGLELTYYYHIDNEDDDGGELAKNLKISVPVRYVLRDDSLEISVNGKNIQHGNERFQVISVSPSPFLCSTSFEKSDNSYIFLPYGIGGTVNTGLDADGKDELVSSNANIASMSIDSYTNAPESSGFRCFGVKEMNNALFCIAESTSDAVGYTSVSGDITMDYSYVAPVLYFADYDYFYGKSVTDGQIKQVSEMYTGTVSIGFYPLYNKKADYNGMAECYRSYLTKNGYLESSELINTASPYSVTYLGGVLASTSTLGIPNKTLKTMTTFNQAQSITKELYDATGALPIARLSGYGETGINIGEVGGGYKYSSKLGSDKSRKELETFLTENGGKLFSDFGLIYYNKSGSGFSYSRDYAQTAVLHAAEISPVNVALRDFNTDLKYRLLSRKKLSKAVEKLEKMISKKDLSAVSLNDVGSVSYSDYGEGSKYAVSAEIEADTKSYINKLKNTGAAVGVSEAKYYAAGLSDVIFDAPLEPSGRYIYANEIPFYQMVFHGLVPMYSSAINTASDVDYKIMLAASTGTGLGFTIVNDFESSYMETATDSLYAMKYDGSKELIINSVLKYKDIYDAVKNAKITSYDILENGVTKTTFDNGKVIYANHTTGDVKTPVGNLSRYDFVMKGGES